MGEPSRMMYPCRIGSRLAYQRRPLYGDIFYNHRLPPHTAPRSSKVVVPLAKDPCHALRAKAQLQAWGSWGGKYPSGITPWPRGADVLPLKRGIPSLAQGPVNAYRALQNLVRRAIRAVLSGVDYVCQFRHIKGTNKALIESPKRLLAAPLRSLSLTPRIITRPISLPTHAFWPPQLPSVPPMWELIGGLGGGELGGLAGLTHPLTLGIEAVVLLIGLGLGLGAALLKFFEPKIASLRAPLGALLAGAYEVRTPAPAPDAHYPHTMTLTRRPYWPLDVGAGAMRLALNERLLYFPYSLFCPHARRR